MKNVNANNNTADGFQALMNNITAPNNTAMGASSLLMNLSGANNTSEGAFALRNNKAGTGNTAAGVNALFVNNNGSFNTAVGLNALYNVSPNPANPAGGAHNIGLGYNAGNLVTTGIYNIEIGNLGNASDTGVTRIGTMGFQSTCFVAGLVTQPSGMPVTWDVVTGQLGYIGSSSRFKDEIAPMDKASEAILALHPVTFHYKKEFDPKKIPQFGLVAEDVVKVNPDLVIRDEKGKPYTVRYEAVNAMLLNEFLKEHRKVEVLEATVAAQQKGFDLEIEDLKATLKAQAAQIQKVSDQVQTQAPAPRVVAND
jgi:hypothetical protein